MPDFPGVPSGGENRRYKANITPDQSAYVGDTRILPGRLLPLGTQEYQVVGWHELEPGEGQPRGVKGIPYSITVPVGTRRADIEEAVLTFAELAMADPDFNYDETDPALGMDLIADINSQPDIAAPLPVAEIAPPLDAIPEGEIGPQIPMAFNIDPETGLPIARLAD